MIPTPSLYRTTGCLLIAESLLLFLPVGILGAAINWPASLDAPADLMLPQLVNQSLPVFVGYGLYLLYSILFYPIALLTAQVVKTDRANPLLLRLAVGFGLASMIARSLGIIRWLAPMPALAQLYVAASTSAPTREAIAVVYTVLNDYAGSIGEVLGVSLFAALWLALIAITILQTRSLPRWLGLFGLFSASLLAIQLLELGGADLGAFISVSVSVLQLWFLVTGLVMLQRARTLTP